MGRQLWIADRCRDFGLKTVEIDGWRTRGRESFFPRGLVCLEPDAVVLTREGLRPIANVVVGNEVWTHRARWRPVTATHRITSSRMRLRAQGADIICTPDHRWLDEDGQWREAAELGSLQHAAPVIDCDAPAIDGFLPSPELLRFIGAWVADGTVVPAARKNPTPRLRLNVRTSKAPVVIGYAQSAGLRTVPCSERDGALPIDVPSGSLHEWTVLHFGYGSAGKTLPAWLFAHPKLAESFLEGYLHGDGCWRVPPKGRPHWMLSSASRALSIGVPMLARSLGMHAYVAQRRATSEGTIRNRRGELVSFVRREQWHGRICPEGGPAQRSAPVRSRTSLEPSDVYDITVADDHSFLADGMWSHNCHHTADGAGEIPSLRILVNGRSDLPGPLCQVGLGRSGTVYVIASGVANHAGRGGWKGLSGNSSVLGIEAENRGTAADPWPAKQLDAYYRLAAALITGPGVGGNVGLVCAHREWAPGRKVDPHSLNMDDFRNRVKAVIEGEQEEDVTPEDHKKIAAAVNAAIEAAVKPLRDELAKVKAATGPVYKDGASANKALYSAALHEDGSVVKDAAGKIADYDEEVHVVRENTDALCEHFQIPPAARRPNPGG